MVKFQFSYLQAGTVNHTVKSFNAMKLPRNNPFRLHLIEKKTGWRRLMERYLSRSDW